MKSDLKQKAIELRRKGFSYSHIKKIISVSSSTLSLWLKDLPYIPNKESIERIQKSREKITIFRKNAKSTSERMAFAQSQKDIGVLSGRDIFMLGIGIYIGEGTKSHGIIRVINADPKILRFAMKWFTSALGFTRENFRLRLHLYPDSNVQDCEKFWSEYLKLPRKFFHKSYIDIRTDKKLAKRGKLPYGTGHLSILSNGKPEHGAFLFRRIKGWMDAVLNE